MRKLIYVAVVAALGLPLTTLAAEQTQRAQPAQAQQQQGAQSQSGNMSQSAQFVPATKLLGMDIKNAKGNDIGEIQDLVVDINNNRVYYAIVDAQGKKFAYPLRVFKFTGGKDEVQLNVAEDRLERAPGMKDFKAKRGIVDPAYDPYWSEVDSYWGERVVDADKKTAAEGDVVPGKTVKVEPRSNMKLAYASNLVGWNIENRTNNDLGEIKDLMINVTNGKVHFAVVDFNKDLAGGVLDNNLHAIPLSAFDFQGGRDDLVLNIDPNKLKAERGFNERQLNAAMTDPNWVVDIDRYLVVLVPIEPAQPGAAGPMGEPTKQGMPSNTQQNRGTQEKSKTQ